MPKSDSKFDDDVNALSQVQVDIIQHLNTWEDISAFEPFTESDVHRLIGKLNSGKSDDEFGLSSEHLKIGKDIIVSYITAIFNEIVSTGKVPEMFKSCVITPVHKKLKYAKFMDNYRGITVSSAICKLFEYVLFDRTSEINNNQSELQFGFTRGLSPNMPPDIQGNYWH